MEEKRRKDCAAVNVGAMDEQQHDDQREPSHHWSGNIHIVTDFVKSASREVSRLARDCLPAPLCEQLLLSPRVPLSRPLMFITAPLSQSHSVIVSRANINRKSEPGRLAEPQRRHSQPLTASPETLCVT
ncbi:hypothetical protein EYF80_021937 [Liparis tanakae]|uniref:Uncharacterized protein n=1 Tax=Liparis tanakae TaxID=230148 RepID=A0A4Z2HS24_9TELE|nr:hypothetical protein EYF80_021937 [Liparis tanakae]